jgi:putative membrane protein
MKPTLNKIIFATGISIAATMAFADDQMPLTGQQFVLTAGAAGLKEVHLGKVALQKSQDADIKSFAKHMVRDHSSANKKLMKIAEKEGLSCAPTNLFSMSDTNSTEVNSNAESAPFNSSAGIGAHNLKGAEELMLALQSPTNVEYLAVQRLEAMPEPDFDQAYANQAVRDHVQAIQLFENASTSLTDKDLQKFAEKTLPTLREHLRMAQDLQNKFGGIQTTNSTRAYLTNSNPGMSMSSWPK